MVKNDFKHMQQVPTFHILADLFANNHKDDIGPTLTHNDAIVFSGNSLFGPDV